MCSCHRLKTWGPNDHSPSGWLVLRIDAVLTEQGVEPLDLGGELPGWLGQVRRRRMRGGPQLLPRGLVGQQFRLPEAQRDGLVEVLGIDGASWGAYGARWGLSCRGGDGQGRI